VNGADLVAATGAFTRLYGRKPAVAAFAPGRANLVGEHTDYNGGFVLPFALHLGVTFLAAPRDDDRVRLRTEAYDAGVEFRAGSEPGSGAEVWASYLRGVVAGFYRAGIATGGFDALVVADLPPGAGLSSSAALEVSCATALEGLCGKRLSQRDKARLCHQAEHEFAGVPCGIMDQFISVMAEPGHLLLIDCASEETRQVAFSGEEMAVLVVDSGLPHQLARGGLARRRDECERAAEALGVVTLRELDAAAFKTTAAGLEPVLYRRASHVISENRRTLAAAAALETADWQGLGRILAEGHVSQRQDFESTCPEIDWLVRFADDDIGPGGGVLGSRMTGGGFGGSTISLVEARRADEIGTRIGQAYRNTLGRDCTWFVARPSAGCRLLETAG